LLHSSAADQLQLTLAKNKPTLHLLQHCSRPHTSYFS
jgi:hypothetical protein